MTITIGIIEVACCAQNESIHRGGRKATKAKAKSIGILTGRPRSSAGRAGGSGVSSPGARQRRIKEGMV